MSSYSHILGCMFGSAYDPVTDTWWALQIFDDGQGLVLKMFDSENEAANYAHNEHVRQLAELEADNTNQYDGAA